MMTRLENMSHGRACFDVGPKTPNGENGQSGAISIAIVEPRQLFREGLQLLLRTPNFTVVAAARSLAEAFSEDAAIVIPDLVVLGSSVELASAGPHVARLRNHASGRGTVRIVFLSDTEELSVLRRVVAAGVDAILSQDVSSDVLCRSLELVALGQQLFPATLTQPAAELSELPQADLIPFPQTAKAGQMLRREHHPHVTTPGFVPEVRRRALLSEREGQILSCLVNGLSNKAIARELHITEATVKVHVKGLLRKTRASNRTQVAIWALNNCPSAEGNTQSAAGASLHRGYDR